MDNFNFTSYSSRDIKGFHQYGYQLGFKHFDAFNIKNLFIQAETNTVQPYTYNFRESGQSYTHYNQPLAHPSGANFSEQTGILRYNYSRVHFEVKTNYIIQGTDSTQNVHYGKDLFKNYQTATTPYPEAELYQGAKHNILHLDANISWIFNPLSGMQFTLGWVYRKENTGEASSHSNQFIYAALRTNLHNFYDDF
jgi:hypothetical protein